MHSPALQLSSSSAPRLLGSSALIEEGDNFSRNSEVFLQRAVRAVVRGDLGEFRGEGLRRRVKSLARLGIDLPSLGDDLPPLGDDLPPLGDDLPPLGDDLPPLGDDLSSKTNTAKTGLIIDRGVERGFEGGRRLKVEGAMEADGVVEGFDVVKNHGMGDGAAGRDEGAEAFGFEGGPEGLPRFARPEGSLRLAISLRSVPWWRCRSSLLCGSCFE
jgi:hypothetical protein